MYYIIVWLSQWNQRCNETQLFLLRILLPLGILCLILKRQEEVNKTDSIIVWKFKLHSGRSFFYSL